MNPRPTPSTRRLPAILLQAFAALLPLTLAAESVVFDADFASGANTASQTPSVITPSATTWYGAYNKPNGVISIDEWGVSITGNASTSAAINLAARITQAPINLTEVGDYIELNGVFYTDGLTNLAFGLFNSGGVDPLTTLLNNGLGTSGEAPGGGTFGWTGYRGMSLHNSVNADFKARPAQTGAAYGSYELLSMGTGGFNSPAAINVGTVVNSTPVAQWNNTDGYTPYGVAFRITRNTATTFAFSLVITELEWIDYDVYAPVAVIYSSTGSTSAAAAQPGAITSTFDAVALGGRVGDGTSVGPVPLLQVASLKVTAQNSDIARITDQPVAQNIPVGGSGGISVSAAGAGALSYQWYKDGSPVSGAISATYSVSGASSAHAGQYHVVVSNTYGYEVSETVTVNVSSLSTPAFTTQPATQAADAGTELTLVAEASGVPTPSYQWYKNDAPISGATLATYTVEYATEADAGTYKVVATNSQGSATSGNATITINTAAPAITTHPTPVTVNVAGAINLTAAASGLPAPSWQWYRNGEPISGATASSYSIASATTADAGTYTVAATNPYGSATSNGALVTVNIVLPGFDLQPPSALTLHHGRRVTLNPIYIGSAPRTYQWYKNDVLIEGAIGSTYTIASASGADSGSYKVVVTNEGGNASSSGTVLTIVGTAETPVFATDFSADTLNDAGAPVTSGSTSWFILSGREATNSSVGDDPATEEVVETRPLTLTWVGTAGSAIMETAARFSATPVALASAGDFLRVRATLGGTNLRTLCFGLYDSHGVAPIPLIGGTGGNTMGGSNAVGGGTQNWTGYRSSLTVGNSSGDIGTRPAQTATTTNRGQELLFPAGSTGAAFGEPAGVFVSANPSTGANAVPGVGATIALNNEQTYTLDYTITLSAANQYTISYALYSGASATGTPLYTTNATTNVAGALPSAVATSFDSLAIGFRNMDNLSEPTLVITDLSVTKGVAAAATAPAITTQPAASLTLTAGDTLTLTAAASGVPAPTWQWYKNDLEIPGATSATYSIGSVVTSDTGAYKATATNSAGSATTNVALVTVNASAGGYASWASGQGLTPGVNDGPTQDPDGDGVSNLLEFVFGGDPLASGTATLPVVAKSGSNLTLTYQIKTAAKTGYTIIPQSSTDLAAAWAEVVHNVAGATIVETTLDGSTNQIVVTVPASGARTFLRVKVEPKP